MISESPVKCFNTEIISAIISKRLHSHIGVIDISRVPSEVLVVKLVKHFGRLTQMILYQNVCNNSKDLLSFS